MGPSPGVVLFLLLLQGAPSRPSQPAPACSVPCLCRQGPRLNCSRAGLSSSTPLELPATVASLDLSRNDLTAMPPRGRDPVPLTEHLVLSGLWSAILPERWMAFDRDRGRLPWQLLCEEPPHLAGRDLLHLDEAELTCAVTHRSATFYQEVSTASGADVLLPCHVQQQGNGSRDTRTKCISPPYEGNALMDPS
uniref:Uncharacterized protein n=1 Tax=Scleropages formosus TaxID=113540 RepID=A0A8C9VIC9_SCLFO